MAKKPNTVGGGSRTNFNGLDFEGRTDLREAIKKHPIYRLDENEHVFKDNSLVAVYFEKHGLYKKFLQPNGIDYKKIFFGPSYVLTTDINQFEAGTPCGKFCIHSLQSPVGSKTSIKNMYRLTFFRV